MNILRERLLAHEAILTCSDLEKVKFLEACDKIGINWSGSRRPLSFIPGESDICFIFEEGYLTYTHSIWLEQYEPSFVITPWQRIASAMLGQPTFNY